MRIDPVSASSVFPVLLLIGCAGPPGPPFGPGPDCTFALGVFVLFLLGGFLYRSAEKKRRAEHQGSSATRIVRERYARGELTREEYQNMMRDLLVP